MSKIHQYTHFFIVNIAASNLHRNQAAQFMSPCITTADTDTKTIHRHFRGRMIRHQQEMTASATVTGDVTPDPYWDKAAKAGYSWICALFSIALCNLHSQTQESSVSIETCHTDCRQLRLQTTSLQKST